MAKKKDLTSKIAGGVQSWKDQAGQSAQSPQLVEPEPEKKIIHVGWQIHAQDLHFTRIHG